jgi:hypothetical protein
VPTAIFALRLLVNRSDPERAGIDLPGLFAGSAGLFALVFGFSNAETQSWTASATIIALVASVVLLGAFVAIEGRVAHPLLPLHVVRDRARGGAYVSVLLASAGMFGVFFFLKKFPMVYTWVSRAGARIGLRRVYPSQPNQGPFGRQLHFA